MHALLVLLNLRAFVWGGASRVVSMINGLVYVLPNGNEQQIYFNICMRGD
jgi:hypothetical protein